MPPDNWNWNLYLFPLWCLGVVLRHCILFPLRLLLLMTGFVMFFLIYFTLRAIFRVRDTATVTVDRGVFRILYGGGNGNGRWCVFSVRYLWHPGQEL